MLALLHNVFVIYPADVFEGQVKHIICRHTRSASVANTNASFDRPLSRPCSYHFLPFYIDTDYMDIIIVQYTRWVISVYIMLVGGTFVIWMA